MTDPTEPARRFIQMIVEATIESLDEREERKRLEEKYGQIWNTKEMEQDFEAIGFQAPFVVVRRKSDNVKGTLTFQHEPRFYFDFVEDRR